MTLTHTVLDVENPPQTLILGAEFVGSAAARLFENEGANCLSIKRNSLKSSERS